MNLNLEKLLPLLSSAGVLGLIVGGMVSAAFGLDASSPVGALITATLASTFLIVLFHRLKDKDEPKDSGTGLPELWLLDTSALIDGRIVALAQHGLTPGPFVVPSFVLDELQMLSDQHDKSRRERGRRGFERLEALKERSEVRNLDEALHDGEPVDAGLVRLAAEFEARLVTSDSGLASRTRGGGSSVLYLHDLAAALRTPVRPGMKLPLDVIRAGDEREQGIGYLEDGTMVVIEGAKESVGETVTVEIKKTIQTKVGPLIFSKIVEEE